MSGKRTKFDRHAEQCKICSAPGPDVCPDGLQLLLEFWYELEQSRLQRNDTESEEMKDYTAYKHPNSDCPHCRDGVKRVRLTDGSLAHEYQSQERAWCEPCTDTTDRRDCYRCGGLLMYSSHICPVCSTNNFGKSC